MSKKKAWKLDSDMWTEKKLGTLVILWKKDLTPREVAEKLGVERPQVGYAVSLLRSKGVYMRARRAINIDYKALKKLSTVGKPHKSDYTQENFTLLIKYWRKAKSVTVVAKKMKLSNRVVVAMAGHLRKQGINVKVFRARRKANGGVNYAKLKKLAGK